MSGFPFFHLPSLAFWNIFSVMDLQTLFNFAMQSTKSRIILKRYFRHRKFQFEILAYFSSRKSLIISCEMFDGSFVLNFPEHLIDQFFPLLENNIYWVLEIFSPSRSTIGLKIENKSPEFISETLLSFKYRNVKLNKVIIISSNSSADKILEQILRSSEDASVVRILCQINKSYQYPSVIKFNSRVEKLELKHAKWITINNLTDIFWKVEKLFLHETSFQKSDFIWFFTKWVEGSIIQNVKLPLNGFPLETWIENVPSAMLARIQFHFPELGEDPVEIEAFTIKQETGEIAVLLEGDDGFVLLVTTHFQLL